MPRPDFNDANDAELLACFAAGRDERAFAEIVRRHGPMVMGVARRQLRQPEDAEDAFQATFLALARVAGSRQWRPCVGGWLHQAAIRTARSIGRMNAHWHKKIESQQRHTKEAYDQHDDIELAYLVDEELRRLPLKIREAVVLCDLEGLKRREAASRLCVPVSTVTSRLAQGRNLLRWRLVRRGIAGAGLVAVTTTKGSAASAVSPALVKLTTNNALQFAAGKVTEIGVPLR